MGPSKWDTLPWLESCTRPYPDHRQRYPIKDPIQIQGNRRRKGREGLAGAGVVRCMRVGVVLKWGGGRGLVVGESGVASGGWWWWGVELGRGGLVGPSGSPQGSPKSPSCPCSSAWPQSKRKSDYNYGNGSGLGSGEQQLGRDSFHPKTGHA